MVCHHSTGPTSYLLVGLFVSCLPLASGAAVLFAVNDLRQLSREWEPADTPITFQREFMMPWATVKTEDGVEHHLNIDHIIRATVGTDSRVLLSFPDDKGLYVSKAEWDAKLRPAIQKSRG